MFDIQISNPTSSCFRNPDDKNLDEAIESIFPLANEFAFIIWNHIFIPLSYKYDMSVMTKDVIQLLKRLDTFEVGSAKIDWPSNTFSSSWEIEFYAGTIIIKATWYNVLGKVTDLLNAFNKIELPRKEFIHKWMILLLFIQRRLEEAGYNSANLEDFHELNDLFKDQENL